MASNSKATELERAMSKVGAILTEQYMQGEGIRREGNIIILPKEGSLEDHILTLQRYASSLEERMNTQIHFDAHPDDALNALGASIEEKFGKLMGTMSFSFFGPRPGQQRTITVGVDQTRVVPIGKAEIFGGLPIVLQISPSYDPNNDVGGWLDVTFSHPRKWLPFVKEIENEARKYLAEKSIFRHKAINSDFSFLDLRYFDKRRVIYSQIEELKLSGEVFAPIVATKQWLDNGGDLKRGVLLYGGFGTGKSLTLTYIAKLCEENGWTFINVLPGGDLKHALRIAQRYQPAVVAVEDIDRDAGRKRTDDVNELINQFDSVISKGQQVMVVMTTNSEDKIQPAMLRPGRIDTSIQMGVLDAQAVRRLVEIQLTDSNGNSLLDGSLNEEELMVAAKGFTLAFVVEAVRRALGYAIMREKSEGKSNGRHGIRITNADVIGGLTGLRDQWRLMNRDDEVRRPDIETSLRELVSEELGPVTKDLAKLTGSVFNDGH